MGAAKSDAMRGAVLATVEGELLAHDFDRLGTPRRQIVEPHDRVPEPTHVLPGERVRSGVRVVRIVSLGPLSSLLYSQVSLHQACCSPGSSVGSDYRPATSVPTRARSR